MNEYIKIPNIYKRESHGKNRLLNGVYATEEIEYISREQWRWTEKVDGTNIRVIWDGYRVSFKGRTDKSEIPKHLLERLQTLFGGTANEEIFEQAFGKKEVILYGEGYGEKIQKHGNLYGEVDFILFDIKVDGLWLYFSSVEDIAKMLGLKSVPCVGVGTLEEAVKYISSHPASRLRDYEMEGIVCRPIVPMYTRYGEPIRVKVKCCDFPFPLEQGKDGYNSAQPERKTGKWIPCSERLPSEDGEYLVTRYAGYLPKKIIIDIAIYCRIRREWQKAYPVIAWMPLPKPYKEEQE